MTSEWRDDPILAGGGACGALLRALDWRANPLGPPAQWPAELRTVVGIALGSKQPMLIVWGPEQTTLYNDGYALMCGNRHPEAMGKPFKDLWFDIWETVEPIIDAAYAGIATSMDDIEFIMHRNGYPEETHFAFSYTPVRNGAGEVLGMFCACLETTGDVLLKRRQGSERARMIQVFEHALGAIAILDGPEHVFSYANSDYRTLIGNRTLDVVGRSVAEALPEVISQGFIELLDRVYQTGEPYFGRDVAVSLRRSLDGEAEERILDFLYHPLTDHDGRIEGIFVQALDVTERSRDKEKLKLLNRELGHRMKNQLALVQAVANQTLRSAPDLSSAHRSLGERIAVLAGAHDILVSGTAERNSVGGIVRQVVAPHDGPALNRFRIDGPELSIASRPALSLSLILHELATNAVKYGALLAETGYVDITWRIERCAEGARMVFRWQESGGPKVRQPERRGSGSRLIEAGLSGTAGSSVSVDYAEDGLRCEIVADLESFQTEQ